MTSRGTLGWRTGEDFFPFPSLLSVAHYSHYPASRDPNRPLCGGERVLQSNSLCGKAGKGIP